MTSGGRCAACHARREQLRGTPAERGYDHRWAARRTHYLRAHPACVLCGRFATVADHYPRSRRQLVAAGVRDPDADHLLRALCRDCHNRQTAQHQPGGWHRPD
jgi:5-methylcytosine-specific restriction protein A